MLRVYTKDWYYNAGIVGFLYVLGDGEVNIEKVVSSYKGSLIIRDNYLEFDPSILDVFFEKYKKLAFVKLFDLDSYKKRLKSLKDKVDQITSSTVPKKLLNDNALNGKVVNNFIKDFCGVSLEEMIEQDKSSLINNLDDKIMNKLNDYDDLSRIYEEINNNANSNFIDYFLEIEVSKK